MALLFDGTNDSVNYGDVAALDTPAAVTWAMWHLPVTSVANDAWVSKRAGANGFVLGADVAGTGVRLITGLAANSGTLTNAVVTGAWQHWAWVYNGAGATNADRLKLYVRGVLKPLAFSGTISATNLVNSGATALLVGQEAAVNFPNMRFAHLRIWASENSDAVLTAQEIRAESESYRPVRTRNLILWCPFDDGTAARDYSGRGNNGTVTGAVQIAGPPISYGGST